MSQFRTYFILTMIFLFCLTPLGRTQEANELQEENEHIVFDFRNAQKRGDWRIVNDDVMGGISRSKIFFNDSSGAIFQGTLSLENNGGFASTRTMPRAYKLSGYNGIKVRIKGDGQDYQMRLRTNGRFDGISYRHHFATEAGKWITVELPFIDFVPVFRGSILRNESTGLTGEYTAIWISDRR